MAGAARRLRRVEARQGRQRVTQGPRAIGCTSAGACSELHLRITPVVSASLRLGFGREQGGRCWSGGTAAATVVLAAIPEERMGPEKSEKTVEGDEAHAQGTKHVLRASPCARCGRDNKMG